MNQFEYFKPGRSYKYIGNAPGHDSRWVKNKIYKVTKDLDAGDYSWIQVEYKTKYCKNECYFDGFPSGWFITPLNQLFIPVNESNTSTIPWL